MPPPFANELIQAKLNPTQLRLRRVTVFNAWNFTKGGNCGEGLGAVLSQRTEIEKPGIQILTRGIEDLCEKGLQKLATSKSHMSTGSVGLY